MSSRDLRAAEIGKADVPRLRQQGDAFAALRARLERAGFTVENDEPGEAYMPHARFEREYQRYPDGRVRFDEPTDCPGEMRVLDKQGSNWALRCDSCDVEWSVRVPTERLTEYLLERAGIPPLFADKEFDKGDLLQKPTLEACRMYVRQFKASPLPGMALWGQAGRGKSHLLALMVETLIRLHQAEAIYRSMAELMGELRAAIKANAFEGTYSRMLNVPVLALDDLGAERTTPAVQEWLSGLVDHRISRELPLLVATNVPPQAWPDAFGERAASRLRGLCLPFKLDGRDRRAQGVQERMAALTGDE